MATSTYEPRPSPAPRRPPRPSSPPLPRARTASLRPPTPPRASSLSTPTPPRTPPRTTSLFPAEARPTPPAPAPTMGFEMLRAAESSRSVRQRRSEDRTRRWADDVRTRGGVLAEQASPENVADMDALVEELNRLSPSAPRQPVGAALGAARHRRLSHSASSSGRSGHGPDSDDDDAYPTLPRRASWRARPSVPALTLSLDPSPSAFAAAALAPGPALSRSLSPTPSSEVEVGTPTTPTPLRPGAHTPTTASPGARAAPLLSIDQIVRKHAGAVTSAVSAAKDKARAELEAGAGVSPGRTHRRTATDSSGADSEDSLGRELAGARWRADSPPHTPVPARTASPAPAPPAPPAPPASHARARTASAGSSLRPTASPSPGAAPPTRSAARDKERDAAASADERLAAAYVRSPALNRIVDLPRAYPRRPLRVSFADVGDPAGRPVLVFLGLGCVRYLVGLYDELARALGLRLLCVDRWGLGRTDQIPQTERAVADWPEVVEGVLDSIGVRKVQVLAHSAGAPYALATALALPERIHGRLHLLAPWVNADVDGGYKWLKWVPNGVIKSALAAEWHIESYMLGKAPLADAATPEARSPVTISSPLGGTDSPTSRASTDTAQTASLARDQRPASRASIASLHSQRAAKALRRPGSASGASGAPERSWSEPTVPRRPDRTDAQADDVAFFADGFDTFATDLHLSAGTGGAAPTPTLSPATSRTTAPSASLPSSPSPRPSPSPSPSAPAAPRHAALLPALTRASHAECLAGTTADLLSVVLGRGARPWGVAYADLRGRHATTVWHGSADERVGSRAMRWVRDASGAELVVLPGEGHNLMSSMRVMCDVLDCLATDPL